MHVQVPSSLLTSYVWPLAEWTLARPDSSKSTRVLSVAPLVLEGTSTVTDLACCILSMSLLASSDMSAAAPVAPPFVDPVLPVDDIVPLPLDFGISYLLPPVYCLS